MTMLDRRKFFSGLLPGGGRSGKASDRATTDAGTERNKRRYERYRALEIYVMADLIPRDAPLSPENDRELRRRVRRTVSAECDDDLFSMSTVTRIEGLTADFLSEIGETGPSSRD